MLLAPGTQLGPYRILGLLGGGGMGEVYQATDTRLKRTVAIKVLQGRLAESAAHRERFEREAQLISQLNHPHICTLYDVGADQGTHYLVMEYVDGVTLETRLRQGPITIEETVAYAAQIADALSVAHRQGIVHRDLKPANIMLTRSRVKLLDFGLAKLSTPSAAVGSTTGANLTEQGTMLGTTQYMAPEQLEGLEADARTDIFAFGAIVYEMLTGKRAFEGGSQASLIAAILKDTPRRISVIEPSVAPGLESTIMRCLAKNPDDRWQSAGDLLFQLRTDSAAGYTASSAIAASGTVTPDPGTTPRQESQPSSPHDRDSPATRRTFWFRHPFAFAATLVLAAVGAAAGLIFGSGHIEQDRSAATTAAGRTQQPATADVTLAVLPFEDLSPEHDQAYFADGVAVELTNSLSRVNGLRVTNNGSSSRYKGEPADSRKIGTSLNVDHLLKGNVRKERDDLRITTQLIDVQSGDVRWSMNYDGKVTSVFAVQEEIAKDVTNALQVALGVGTLAVPGMTHNVEAYDEYLKANALVGDPKQAQELTNHLQRAVHLDPGFAMAWLGLETGYRLGATFSPDASNELWERSRDAYENARQAAPDSPDVLLIGAIHEAHDHHWRAAGALYQTYRSTAAKYTTLTQREGLFLMAVGKTSQAIVALERAKAASPLDPAVNLAEAYSHQRNLTRSLAEFRSGLALGRNQGVLLGAASFAALATGDRDEIRKWLTPNHPMLPFLDDPSAGLAAIRRQFAEQAGRDHPDAGVMFLAAWAAYFGDPELALEMQRKYVFTSVDPMRPAFGLWEPVYADMRKLPGFKDLVRDMGLVDYWRTYDWNDFCHSVAADDFECT